MDFTKLNTKNDNEKGAFLHLRHSKYDHKMYTGEGADEFGRLVDASKPHEKVGVDVRGFESPSVQKVIDRVRRKNLRDPKNMDEYEMGIRVACALVMKFHGITQDGAPLEATEDNKRAFFEQSDSLVKQVRHFAEDRSNFFAELPDG